jgi:hypothetical protein
MVLDERRMSEKRNGCLCCIRHPTFSSYEFSKSSILNKVRTQLPDDACLD